jgi:nicotinate-nucleotide adenylyltransferase
LRLLDAVLARLPLDVIHVVPAAVPPLRPQPVAGTAHRVEMVRLAISDKPRLLCDTREVEQQGTSYTVLTLESLRREFPRDRLSLILGRDAFDQLPRWRRADDILAMADILVVNRPGYPGDRKPARKQPETGPATTRIVELEIPPTDVSATEVRRRLAAGEDVTGMLPDEVLSYIHANQLYV